MNLFVKTIPAAAIALFGATAFAQTTILEADFDSLEAGAVTAASLNSVTTGGSWALNTDRTGNYVIADDNGDKAFGMDDTGTTQFVNFATLTLTSPVDFSVDPVTVDFRTATRRTGVDKGLRYQFRSGGVAVATLIWQQNNQWGGGTSNLLLVGHNEEGASGGPGVTYDDGSSSFAFCLNWDSDNAAVRDARFTFQGAVLMLSFGGQDFSVALTNSTIDTIDFSTSGSATGAKGAWIDDITITSGVVVSPSDFKVLSISKTGVTVSVGFQGTDGQTYNLNKSTNLDFTTPDIRDTETLTGTDTGTLIDISATEDAAFYRVEQQP